MAASQTTEKGLRYIIQLDAARCDGNWADVPELARKVEKHAPRRKCLITTARVEAKIASQPVQKSESAAQSTNTQSEKSDKSLPPLVKELETAIQSEDSNTEDKFQAQTCLAWLYWNDSDYRKARDAAPKIIPTTNGGQRLGDWTTVCVIKAAFFRASSEEGLANLKNVPLTYEACLSGLQSLTPPTSAITEFCFWWERFFNRCCGCFYGIFSEKVQAKRRNVDTKACLQAFRTWASNWDILAGTMNSSSEPAKQKRNQRLLVWKSYYHVLSSILQLGYSYSSPFKYTTSSDAITNGTSSPRKLLLLELEKVEAQYESLLLRQVSFPKANARNTEVVEWADALVANWSINCGPDWQDEDLSQGGRATATRRTIDSMYRAAALTFHSSTVMRHLFTLHTALAEFTLAEKALDTYLEIMNKGKARVKKSGNPEPDLDSDEIMLQTIVSGIEMLCEYGKRDQVIKSIGLVNRLLDWNSEHEDTIQDQNSDSVQNATQEISEHVKASMFRAIAVSKASWARLSYEPKERTALQADAIKYFKLALRADHSSEENPSFLYPLALILAEMRNIEGAVAVIKQALAAESKIAESADRRSLLQAPQTKPKPNRSLNECWHLLSLLLSSRQDFDTAEAATRTVLDQYDTEDKSSKAVNTARKLPFFQKKQIIEVKMTQVLLVEISEGSQNAINLSAELLSLYARFFEAPKPQTVAAARVDKAPMTATGTVKSFRGSVFGRYRKSVRNSMLSLAQPDGAHEEHPTPTIAVTAEDTTTPRPMSQFPLRTASSKLQKSRSRQSVRRSRSVSPARPDTQTSMGDSTETASQLRPISLYSNDPGEVGLAVSHDYPTVQTAQAVSMRPAQALRLDSNTESRPLKSPELSEVSLDLPNDQHLQTPLPFFSRQEEERYSTALLNQIWLFISALYRRGNNLEDARQAMDEAFKQAKLVEAAKARPGPASAKTFDEPGWGGMKSVEEIWADSYAEEGHLCNAQGDPHEAMVKYEGALSHFPDHADATVSLAHVLLDIHAKKIPLSQQQPTLADPAKKQQPEDESAQPVFSTPITQTTKVERTNGFDADEDHDTTNHQDAGENTENNLSNDLDLLAARDRAYIMLYNLTKLGTGWDDSEAWFALGNAYEASGQVEKAKEVLWWVVDLEEKRPIRHWRCLGQGFKLRR